MWEGPGPAQRGGGPLRAAVEVEGVGAPSAGGAGWRGEPAGRLLAETRGLAGVRLHCLGQGRSLGVLPVAFACAGSAGLVRLRPHAFNPAAWPWNPCATVILVFPPAAVGSSPDSAAFFRDRVRPGLKGALTRARERERAALAAGRSPYLAGGDRVVVVVDQSAVTGPSGAGANGVNDPPPAPASTSFGAKFRKTTPASLFERVRDECGSGWRGTAREPAGGPVREHVVRWDPADPDSWRLGPERVLAQTAQRALDARLMAYQEEAQALSAARLAPGWSFQRFFVVKEAHAQLFEMTGLHDDALREYTELEYTYLDSLQARQKDDSPLVGGDGAALLDPRRTSVREWCQSGGMQEIDVRQYLFARQSALLLQMGQPETVAKRGIAFVESLAERLQPGAADLWIFSACVALAESTRGKLIGGGSGVDDGGDGGEGALREQTYAGTLAELYAKARSRLVALGGQEGFNAIRLSPSPCFSRPLVGSRGPSRTGSIESAQAGALYRGQSDSFESALVQLERESYGASGVDEGDSFFCAEEAVYQAVTEGFWEYGGGAADYFADGDEVGSIGSPCVLSPIGSQNDDGMGAEGGARCEMPTPEGEASEGTPSHTAAPPLLRNPHLAAAFRSKTAYEELLIELSRKAAELYRRAGRPRHAAEVEGDIAGLLFEAGNLGQAEILLKEQCERYQAEGWEVLQSAALPMLLRAQVGLWESGCRRGGALAVGMADTIVQLLGVHDCGRNAGHESREALLDRLLSVAGSRKCVDPDAEGAGEDERLEEEVDATAVVRIDGRTLWEGAGGGSAVTSRSIHVADVGKFSLSVVSCFPAKVSLQDVSLTLVRREGEAKGFGRRRRSIIASQASEARGPAERFLHCFLSGDEAEITLEPGPNLLQLSVQPTATGEYTTHALHFAIRSVKFLSYVPPGPWNQVPFSMLPFHRATRLKVVPEVERVRVTAAAETCCGVVSGGEQWLALQIEPLHDRLRDCRLSIVLAEEGGITFSPGQDVHGTVSEDADEGGGGFGSPFSSGCEKGAQRLEGVVEAKEGYVKLLPSHAETPCTIWLRVRTPCLEPMRITLEPGSLEKTHRQQEAGPELRLATGLEYNDGAPHCHEATFCVPVLRPFAVQTEFAVLGPETLLVEISLRNHTAWDIELHKSSLQFDSGIEVLQDTVSEGGLLPAKVQPGGLFSFLFYLGTKANVTTAAAEDVTSNLFSVDYAWAGAVRTAFSLGNVPQEADFGDVLRPRTIAPISTAPAASSPVSDTFSLDFKLQLPAYRYAVGLRELPVSTRGSPAEMVWSVEHIGEAATETIEYEVVYDTTVWLLSGRRIGKVTVSAGGAPADVRLAFIPTSAGALPAPQILLSCPGGGRVFTSPLASSTVPVRPPPFQEAWMVPSPLAGALLESP